MANTNVIYGREIPRGVHPIYFLLKLLRKHGEAGFTELDGLPSKLELYKKVVLALWGEKKLFDFDPWTELASEAFLTYDRVSLAGGATTAKSHGMAAYGIVYWLEDPINTLVLCTSTTLGSAKKRIWGSVEKLFYGLPSKLFPAKMRDQPDPGIIFTLGDRDRTRLSQSGLYLIPADKGSASQETSSKLLGMKNKRVLLLADELGSLKESLVKIAFSNLQMNPKFSVIAAFNPDSFFDSFGQFSTPIDSIGWQGLTSDVESYPLKNGGIGLHFNHLKNPNYLAQKNLYPHLASFESINRAIKEQGLNSYESQRMLIGWYPSLGIDNTIFTESDILKYEGTKKTTWAAERTRVAGCDPSWTADGDNTVLRFGWYGKDVNGLNVIEFDKYYIVREDTTQKDIPRNTQICRNILKLLEQEHCALKNFAVDSTSGGSVFCDALATEAGSNEFYRVNFGGDASDKPVSEFDPTIAKDFYANRVTEIWFSGLYYLRAGQLKNMDVDMIKELTQRKYKLQGKRKIAESKRDMKSRIGKSPDNADASMILVALCRERLGASPVKQLSKSKDNTWKKISQKYDIVSRSENAEFVTGSETYNNSLDNLI